MVVVGLNEILNEHFTYLEKHLSVFNESYVLLMFNAQQKRWWSGCDAYFRPIKRPLCLALSFLYSSNSLLAGWNL